MSSPQAQLREEHATAPGTNPGLATGSHSDPKAMNTGSLAENVAVAAESSGGITPSPAPSHGDPNATDVPLRTSGIRRRRSSSSSSSESRHDAADDEDCAIGDMLGLGSVDPLTSAHPTAFTTTTTSATRTLFPPPSVALTQTFLDLGQLGSIDLGRTCPDCGMLFTTHHEDIRLHRRVCAAARRQAATYYPRCRTSLDEELGASTPARLDFAASAEAVRLLDALCEKPKGITTAITATVGGRTHAMSSGHAHGSSVTLVVPCEKSALSPQSARETSTRHSHFATYTLRGASPAVHANLQVVRLLESLGFANVALRAMEYIIVVAVSNTLGRIVAAVAGRSHRTQQEPEVVVEALVGTREQYRGYRERCTQCDVDDVYIAPPPLVAQVAATAAAAVSTLTSHREAFRRLFARPDPAQVERARQATEQRMECVRRRALRAALFALGRAVIYGHQLQPASDFSYDETIAGHWRHSEPPADARVSRELLALAVLAESDADEDFIVVEDTPFSNDKENKDPVDPIDWQISFGQLSFHRHRNTWGDTSDSDDTNLEGDRRCTNASAEDEHP